MARINISTDHYSVTLVYDTESVRKELSFRRHDKSVSDSYLCNWISNRIAGYLASHFIEAIDRTDST